MNAHLSAFPQTAVMNAGRYDWPDEYGREGLTKRELFAAMAMQGLLADPYTSGSHQIVADESIKFADALIAELAKEPSSGNR
jgi:hypothetical protein